MSESTEHAVMAVTGLVFAFIFPALCFLTVGVHW